MAEPASFTYSHHLVRLIARSEAAAARLSTADRARRAAMAPQARTQIARLSARLDGSPLTDETAEAVEADRHRASRRARPLHPRAGGGGWAEALRLEGMATQEVAGVEYANLLACHDLEGEVASEVFTAPLTTLTRLHGQLVDGLADPHRVGRLRQSAQDMHDGAQGTVVFRAPDPARLPALLDSLVGWLGHGSAGKPALVVAGVVHERLLEWQPFDAANGRLARSAARVVLRARGMDPDGLAVVERDLAADPLGYVRQVAASMRRGGQLAGWLEWLGEAVAAALERASDRAHGASPARPPARAIEVATQLGAGEPITLPEYESRLGIDRENADLELSALCRAGWLRAQPGTRGLRFARVEGGPTGEAPSWPVGHA